MNMYTEGLFCNLISGLPVLYCYHVYFIKISAEVILQLTEYKLFTLFLYPLKLLTIHREMHAQENVGSLLILHGGVRWWHLTHDNLSKYMYKLHPSSVVRKYFQYLTRMLAFGKSL